MSRIGRMPIAVPAGVTVEVAAGNVVTVKGPKGTLTKELHPDMIIKQEGAEVTVSRPSETVSGSHPGRSVSADIESRLKKSHSGHTQILHRH